MPTGETYTISVYSYTQPDSTDPIHGRLKLKEYTLTIKPMSSDTSIKVYANFESGGESHQVEGVYNASNGTFTVDVSADATNIVVSAVPVNEFATAGVYAQGDATVAAVFNRTDASPNWTGFWSWRNVKHTSGGVNDGQRSDSTSVVFATGATMAQVYAQVQAQDGSYYQQKNSIPPAWGYEINLIKRNSDAEIIQAWNTNISPTDEYYYAKRENADGSVNEESGEVFVLYVDSDKYNPHPTGANVNIEPSSMADLRMRPVGSSKWLTPTGASATAENWWINAGVGTFANYGMQKRGKYVVQVRSEDKLTIKEYTLIIANKSDMTETGFVEARIVGEENPNEYHVFHDMSATISGSVKTYHAYAPESDNSNLEVIPANPYAVITSIKVDGVEEINNATIIKATQKDEPVTVDAYSSGKYKYGPLMVGIPAGSTDVNVEVTLTSQDGHNTSTWKLELKRRDADVSVNSVSVDGNVNTTPAGYAYQFPTSETTVTINMLTNGSNIRAFGLVPTPLLVPTVNLTQKHTLSSTLAEGETEQVYFVVRDDNFYYPGDSKYTGDDVTPYAKRQYSIDLFRTTHETTVGKILVTVPVKDKDGNATTITYEAIAREDNPTVYEVAMPSIDASPAAPRIDKIEIYPDNPYTKIEYNDTKNFGTTVDLSLIHI